MKPTSDTPLFVRVLIEQNRLIDESIRALEARVQEITDQRVATENELGLINEKIVGVKDAVTAFEASKNMVLRGVQASAEDVRASLLDELARLQSEVSSYKELVKGELDSVKDTLSVSTQEAQQRLSKVATTLDEVLQRPAPVFPTERIDEAFTRIDSLSTALGELPAPLPPETPLGIASKLNTLTEAIDISTIRGFPYIPTYEELRDYLEDDNQFRNWLERFTSDVTVRVGGGAATSSGATAFTQLTDVPNAYTGAANQFVVVNPTETGLTFSPTVPADTFNRVTVTADYTVTNADDYIDVDATAGPITITLPDPTTLANIRDPFWITLIAATNNVVTVQAASGLINGDSTGEMMFKDTSIGFRRLGANYQCI